MTGKATGTRAHFMFIAMLQTWGDFKTAFIEQMIKALPQTFDTFRIFMVLLSVWIAREVYKIRRGQKERQQRDKESDAKATSKTLRTRRATDLPELPPVNQVGLQQQPATFDEFERNISRDKLQIPTDEEESAT